MVNQKLLVGLLPMLLGSAGASPLELLERADCNRDNLLRCFVGERSASQASAFCAGLTPFTTTVAGHGV